MSDSTKNRCPEEQKETPWIDAWIRWERGSKGGEIDYDCNDGDDDDDEEQELNPTDSYSYSYRKIKAGKDGNDGDDDKEDASSHETITISLKGFDSDSEAIWNSTGLTIWRSSEYLCEYLVQNARMLEGDCRMLEVGSGLGRSGILAHLLSSEGIGRTILTDGDTDTLKQLRRNVRENVPSRNNDTTLSCLQLLWGEKTAQKFLRDHCTVGEEAQLFDVVFGSDLLYAASVVKPLFETVKEIIKPDGVFVMAHCSRREGNEVNIDMVLAEAERLGFCHQVVDEADGIYVYECRQRKVVST